MQNTDSLPDVGNRRSFWQLLSEYNIEIPIIQRDYAQGRNDEKTQGIRTDLLEAIFDALEHNRPLDFDFIYGSTIAGENGKKTLCPLDGQQRLTTLFLLHWYVLQKTGSPEIKKLAGFTYKTRISSREFCNALVNETAEPLPDDQPISKALKNTSWYFIAWRHDPTVQAMLTMLDDIDDMFKDAKPDLAAKLIEKKLITFQFVELSNFGLSDDLYIKMNARGKLLTDFEKLKVTFGKLLDGNGHTDSSKKFSASIEHAWEDFFWKYREENVIDRPFMRFFWFVTEMLYAYDNEPAGPSPSPFEYDADKNPIVNHELIDEVYNKRENVTKLFDILDCIKKIDWKNVNNKVTNAFQPSWRKSDRSLFESCAKQGTDKSSDDFTFRDKIILYSIIEFFLKNPGVDADDNMIDLVRVVQNCLEKVRQRSGASFTSDILFPDLHNCLRNICDFFISQKNIYVAIAEGQSDIGRHRFADGYRHEREKALCINKDSRWKKLIHEIEDYRFCRGLIYNFLYADDYDKTNRYFAICKKVWDPDHLNKSAHSRIALAWLSVTEYEVLFKEDKLVGESQGKIYCIFGDHKKDNKWHFLFTLPGDEKIARDIPDIPDIKQSLSEFFEAYDKHQQHNNLAATAVLDSMINAYLTDSTVPRDWRWHYISYVAAGFHSDSFMDIILSSPFVYIDDNSGCNIRLLVRDNLMGKNYHPYLLFARMQLEQDIAPNDFPLKIEISQDYTGWVNGSGVPRLKLLLRKNKEEVGISVRFEPAGIIASVPNDSPVSSIAVLKKWPCGTHNLSHNKESSSVDEKHVEKEYLLKLADAGSDSFDYPKSIADVMCKFLIAYSK